MGRKPCYVESLFRYLKRNSKSIQKINTNLREKHSHRIDGFKKMNGKDSKIKCIREGIFFKPSEKSIIKVLRNYSTSSQKLPVLTEDYPNPSIKFCDFYELTDCDSSQIDLLEITDSEYELLKSADYRKYYRNTRSNVFSEKFYLSASDIGKNVDEELFSLYNPKINKRIRGFAQNIRDMRLRKYSQLINEVNTFNFNDSIFTFDTPRITSRHQNHRQIYQNTLQDFMFICSA